MFYHMKILSLNPLFCSVSWPCCMGLESHAVISTWQSVVGNYGRPCRRCAVELGEWHASLRHESPDHGPFLKLVSCGWVHSFRIVCVYGFNISGMNKEFRTQYVSEVAKNLRTKAP